jgi:branched-subunit amino acid transport protein
MLIDYEYIILVAAMGIVTYVPRWAPLFFLTSRTLPAWLVEWLDLIPASILSALLLPSILAVGEPRQLILFQPKLLAAIPTLMFALKTKSLGGTVVVGMALYWFLGKFI